MTDNRAVQQVLWDWNGTLLDDVELCVFALNTIRARRGMPPISIEEYRAAFTFPVIEYYKGIGFDFEKEPFAAPAEEWIEIYHSNLRTRARLYDYAVEVLKRLQAKGIAQGVLSAHHHGMLVEAMERFGVASFFDPILGLGDYYADSKIALGQSWLASSGLDPAAVLLIGDTLHDHEVARTLNIRCVLLAQGHQTRDRLLQTGLPVLASIREIPDFLDHGFQP